MANSRINRYELLFVDDEDNCFDPPVPQVMNIAIKKPPALVKAVKKPKVASTIIKKLNLEREKNVNTTTTTIPKSGVGPKIAAARSNANRISKPYNKRTDGGGNVVKQSDNKNAIENAKSQTNVVRSKYNNRGNRTQPFNRIRAEQRSNVGMRGENRAVGHPKSSPKVDGKATEKIPKGTTAAAAKVDEKGADVEKNSEPIVTEQLKLKEMTLDEWKALREPRTKPNFNTRKAGEGEDCTQWTEMLTLCNKKKEEGCDGETEYDPSSNLQRVGRMQRVVDVHFRYRDERRYGGIARGRRRAHEYFLDGAESVGEHEVVSSKLHKEYEVQFPTL